MKLHTYRRYCCFKGNYICEKLPKKVEIQLYKENKIIEQAQKRIIKLLKIQEITKSSLRKMVAKK